MRRLAPLATALVLALSALLPAVLTAPAQAQHALATHTVLAAAAPEGADKSGVIATPKQGLAPAITALVVFAIVCVVLMTQVWPKIVTGLDERAQKIRDEIAAAEAARKQAADRLDEYESSLAEARAEAAKMIEDTKAKQATIAAELRSKADKELTDLRQKALADIENAKKAALSEIYNESVALATTMAGRILQREVTVDDQQRLVSESLAQLDSTRNN